MDGEHGRYLIWLVMFSPLRWAFDLTFLLLLVYPRRRRRK
jgi:hypothetical protein